MISSKDIYISWYDDKIKEIISIEKKHMTKALLAQLEKENIQVIECLCSSIKEANDIYLNGIKDTQLRNKILTDLEEQTEINKMLDSSGRDLEKLIQEEEITISKKHLFH